MSAEPTRASPPTEGRHFVGLAFVLASVIRCVLALAFPTIHGGDATARLANPDQLVLGYQLPLPQLFVMAAKALLDDPLFARLVFCLWGGVLAAGVTALLGVFAGSRAALFGAVLLSFDPLLIHYSIVPYQEATAYGLLAWAFYFAARGRVCIAAALFGAASMSRYEAWLFLPAFWWLTRSPLATVLAFLPILGWTAWWHGLAPTGLYVLDLDVEASRLSRVVFLGRKFLEYEGAGLAALTIATLVWALARPAVDLLKCILGICLPIAVVVALGHEYPPGSGLMSERLIHFPVLLALGLAAIGLSRLSCRSRLLHVVCSSLVALLAARNLRFEIDLLNAAAVEPDLALARDVARSILLNRREGECVTVRAPTVDPALLTAYVAKVDNAFGDTSRARERARALASSSPDRDRIAAHLAARAGTVRSEPGCPLTVLVDGYPAEGSEGVSERDVLISEITAGPRRARLLRNRP